MQNFGKIKNVFNNLLIEGIVTKDESAKKLFKKYIKTIRESEILKTQFFVYSNIENKVDNDPMSISLFVSENIKLLEQFKPADILKENEKLGKLMPRAKVTDDYDLSPLHESLTKLIFIKRTPQNVEKVTSEIKNITSYIAGNKAKEVNESIDLPISVLTNLMVEKYNDKYNTLDESDKETLKLFIDSDFEAKKKYYDKVVTECTVLVDKNLQTADDESREKLLKVKTKLLRDKEELNENEFIAEIFKLVDLRYNLLNN